MIDLKDLEQFQHDYDSDPTNKTIAGAIAKNGINHASLNNETLRVHDYQFSDLTKRGAITNQKSSGRCWMFSALNTARVSTMKKLNLKTFEFSQAYPLFCDKLEKSNYFLESILETLDQASDSRLIMHLLQGPIQDGGQWDMFAGILKKYGAVPKTVMPETFHSSNTSMMNRFITSKLRQFAHDLRQGHKEGKSMETLKKEKQAMLSTIYGILTKCLGELPRRFDFAYRDEDDKFFRYEGLTPQEFFEKFVGWDLDNRVSLINAPQASKPFNKVYTVKYLGSVKELYPIRYINVELDVLKKAAIASIKDGEPVWFGCDVGQLSDRDSGIMDAKLYNYDLTLGGYTKLDKGARLDYGDSLLTHAMVFTGVDLDKNGKPIKWQVENSWGDAPGNKGIFSMSDAWFDSYNYQITVDKKYVDQAILDCLKEDVIELEPWDPMGALALVK